MNEVKKVYREFNKIASQLINSDYREQNTKLKEMLDYIENTPLIKEYLQNLEYDINDECLNNLFKNVSMNRCKVIDFGSNADKRTYLLYRIFSHTLKIGENSFAFGWNYTNSNNRQDYAKAFGDRMVSPFVSEINSHIEHILDNMECYENNAPCNININNVNSSGVQLNIAERGSIINADQENKFRSEDVINAINKVEDIVMSLKNTDDKGVLNQNLDMLKDEVKKDKPNKKLLETFLKSMNHIAKSIVEFPDLINGIKMIASIMGLKV